MQSSRKNSISTHSDKTSPIRDNAITLEEKILQFSGLIPNQDITITDVPITFSGENFIHTYHCGNKENKTLVLIHGYGGSSALFYSILKDLSSEFSVYCLDLLGMGLSSRPDFSCQTPEEATAYFVDSIEKWREAVGIKEFYLGGHSFGAYMAINYTIKYREQVKKLILISPIGITADQDPYAFMEWVNQMGWIKKKMYKMYIKLWEDKATPFEFLQKHSLIGGFILKKYLQKQYQGVENSSKIISLLEKMFFKLAKLPAGSEKALHCLFGPPLAIPKISMEYELFEHVSVPTHFFYGEADWVDWLGAHRLANSEVKTNFTFKWIKDSGHQIFASKPKEISKEIIEVLKE